VRLPDKCRIDEIYITAGTDWAESSSGNEPGLTERGSFQGSATTGLANRGRASFLVPTNAANGKTYYAGMKIHNDGNVQYISISVKVDYAGSTNIYNNGLTSLSSADHSKTVTLTSIQAAAQTVTTSWWNTAANQVANW